ncbi:MAG TPA: efflux RND transporter periplasmic adaptor subunit [Rectinemataceae bacterium]|nr:efflux RND transporter periplasmic adaptor subunit [Rectinemataceae bacterium]
MSILARPLATASAVVLAVSILAACSKPVTTEKKPLDLISVSVASAERRQVAPHFAILGSLKANNEVTVVSETSGTIVAVPVKTGDHVAEGATLVRVDKDLREAAYIAAEAAYTKAARDAQRAQDLQVGGMVSEASAESAKLAELGAKSQYLIAQKELENTSIRTKIAGIVADTYVSTGGQVGPGTPVALVVDTSSLKVRVLLPEAQALVEHKGDQVLVSSELLPGKTFLGLVDSISVRGDETHSFPVEIRLGTEANASLRPGMSVRLVFSQAPRQALLLPRTAIVGSVKDPQVFVVKSENGRDIVESRDVVTGEEFGTDIELLSGLSEQERVVVAGQSLLSLGQAVAVRSTSAGSDTRLGSTAAARSDVATEGATGGATGGEE